MAKVLPEAKEGIRYFPCETKLCPHIHGNWSGYCPECTRNSWLLPPGSLKRLKIAGRKARLLFITLVMSFLETEDKVLLALFGGSIALVCFFYCLAERQWAALVLVIAACASLALSIVGVPWQNFMDGNSYWDDCTSTSSFNEDITAWDTSGVTAMNHMFQSASSFNQPIGTWTVGEVRQTNGMFKSANMFNQDLSAWSVDRVTDMNKMFFEASAFNQDIGAWDTSGVTSMTHMFKRASAFNQDIGGWAVHSVTSMYQMFNDASAFDQDLGDWAVHNVRTMKWMFAKATSFDQDLGWCVDDDVNLEYAFTDAPCASTSCGVTQGSCT